MVSALLIATLHLANRWDRATAYPWTDVAGVAAVLGVQASVNPDSSIEQSSQSPIDVLEYGERG